MEENGKKIESLIKSTVSYGKTRLKLLKLKAIYKTTDFVSSMIPYSFVVFFISSFILFLGLGFALWLGEILGKIYYGLFIVAAFYGLTGVFVHFVMHKYLKRRVGNRLIKKALN